jgi:hypothetical protein
MRNDVLLGDISIDSTKMHLNRCFVILEQTELLAQFLLALLFHSLEHIFIEILGPPEAVQLIALPILFEFAAMENDKAKLILRIEIPNHLNLFAGGFDFSDALLEHKLDYM